MVLAEAVLWVAFQMFLDALPCGEKGCRSVFFIDNGRLKAHDGPRLPRPGDSAKSSGRGGFVFAQGNAPPRHVRIAYAFIHSSL